ncbi:sortase-associated OmpA-like protein PdsO [Colwellia sp. 4_MG-2023]|uniref:sortase-associated OmpA-like protein PdsO n=1 Tax=unclassified Colwellia TaxID=196834 RepID=UPI0026E4178B|nr:MULTISPECIES: sortase-associated OmpA-like protein PdsO [unclassified Colwellia]MDO6505439.1 sortase-associated OmpA-like protein PdsO [Colwellia sp. 5_MG-2023]MDO6554265.1 sortase-associated OmpA-like protein PdsO [Colwellia sp. 4_MG-2023]
MTKMQSTMLKEQLKEQQTTHLKYNSSRNYTKILLSTMLVTVITSTSVSAFENDIDKQLTLTEKQQSKTNNENIGFGTGALIGGIAAGPVGAFIAGLGGTLIAKLMNANDENEALTATLLQEKQTYQLSSKQAEQQYQEKLQHVEESYQYQLAALENQQKQEGQLQADKLLMSLQFSTGSSDIAAHYQEQVAALASILNNSPSMKIDLSGYTDLTGEEAHNQALSKARVNSVKTLLMAQGVDEQQIATFAFGEKSPVVANNEHKMSFYDRRVLLKLYKPSMLEHNQMANNH